MHTEILDKAQWATFLPPGLHLVGARQARTLTFCAMIITTELWDWWYVSSSILHNFRETGLPALHKHTHTHIHTHVNLYRLISHAYRFHVDVVLFFTTGKRKRDTTKRRRKFTRTVTSNNTKLRANSENTTQSKITKVQHEVQWNVFGIFFSAF